MTLPVIALGGVGVISVASNEIPREMAEMTRAALNNDWTAARQVLKKYLPLMQANFIESSPMPVKAVLAMMGRLEEAYRLPMVQMRRDTRSKLQRIASEVGLIAKVAAATADAHSFFVYENWAAGPHRLCCIVRTAASATTERHGLWDIRPTTPAGMGLMRRSQKPGKRCRRCPAS